MNQLSIQPEPIMEVAPPAGLAAPSEVDIQVATAKRWPRNLDRFLQNARGMAIRNPKVADACFYDIPRGGKRLKDGSIRLAEIIAVTWGNLRWKSRIIGVEDIFVRSRGTCWDLESNVARESDCLRGITNSAGNRYSNDMVVVTGNAASSIAARNVVFSIVPRVFVDEIVAHCIEVAEGRRGNLETERKKWLAWYAERDVSTDQVLALLEKGGVEEIGIEDITTLQGLANALDDKETTIADVFGAPGVQDGTRKFGFKKKNGNGAAADKSK